MTLTEKFKTNNGFIMAESEQIRWTYVKIENVAEIYSARIDSNQLSLNVEFRQHIPNALTTPL